MNRRSFLSALAGAMVLDPERAIWRPGAKLISIPKPREFDMLAAQLRRQQAFQQLHFVQVLSASKLSGMSWHEAHIEAVRQMQTTASWVSRV